MPLLSARISHGAPLDLTIKCAKQLYTTLTVFIKHETSAVAARNTLRYSNVKCDIVCDSVCDSVCDIASSQANPPIGVRQGVQGSKPPAGSKPQAGSRGPSEMTSLPI